MGVTMHLDPEWNSAQRDRLAERMLAYYRSNEEYFEYFHDDSGGERPSQEEREMYQVIVANYEKAPDEVSRVLELGCGRAQSIGALLDSIGKCTYSGIEASIAAVKAAQMEHPEYDVRNGDITDLPFSAASFDIVTLNYVLEHLPAPYLVIDEILRVLRPGGLVAMIAPVSDLPWALPRSLRYKSRDMLFTASYAARRWWQQMRLRYDPHFFAFELLEEPQVLVHPEETFEYDDDLVYNGSTLEITKYLRHKKCSIVSAVGRDIQPFIRSGRRLPVDLLRTIIFAAYRCSLFALSKRNYTTTLSVVARRIG
jgi:SAM-dependent methyltransferase